jgi:hypothetical protein
MAEKQWCPGCSREVESVCHHFNCAIGPNGLDAQSRSSAGSRDPWRTNRTISHTEAREIATRLINSHFNKEPHARVGIPARPDYDDDLLIVSYIKQQEEKESGAPAQGSLNREQMLERAISEACDLLAERTYGNAARSPGHNARLRLEQALVAQVYAAQPPAAPVDTSARSDGKTIGEFYGDPGARCSAGTEPAGWLVDRPGDPTFPRFYRTEDEAKAMEAFITVSPRGNVRPVFTHAPQTAASPEISRLIAKSDEQTTALDQIMTTAADNLAAANSDLKMTLEFIHHVAEYTLAVTRPHQAGGEA